MPHPPNSNARVVIVGAGAAGLAATRRLHDAGIDVLLIEARERIGGRAWTVEHDGMPIDLGCGWLHSADRNPWAGIAEARGFTIDRSTPPWGKPRNDPGFGTAEQREFFAASSRFYDRLEQAAATQPDAPADTLLEPASRWNPLLNAVSSYINGETLDRVSIVDFDRYADTEVNWRVREGYGALIGSIGDRLPLRLGVPVTGIDLDGRGIRLATAQGDIDAERVILAIPSTVLASDTLRLTAALDNHRHAASVLPLGANNKLYMRLDQPEAFAVDNSLRGSLTTSYTGSYNFRPLGQPLVEGFFGGDLARDLEAGGLLAFFDFAVAQITDRLGSDIRKGLSPLVASAWSGDPFARGGYSHALPGDADARAVLAQPLDNRLFFAGEACSRHDYSTAHGAWLTGVAAADAVGCIALMPAGYRGAWRGVVNATCGAYARREETARAPSGKNLHRLFPPRLPLVQRRAAAEGGRGVPRARRRSARFRSLRHEVRSGRARLRLHGLHAGPAPRLFRRAEARLACRHAVRRHQGRNREDRLVRHADFAVSALLVLAAGHAEGVDRPRLRARIRLRERQVVRARRPYRQARHAVHHHGGLPANDGGGRPQWPDGRASLARAIRHARVLRLRRAGAVHRQRGALCGRARPRRPACRVRGASCRAARRKALPFHRREEFDKGWKMKPEVEPRTVGHYFGRMPAEEFRKLKP